MYQGSVVFGLLARYLESDTSIFPVNLSLLAIKSCNDFMKRSYAAQLAKG